MFPHTWGIVTADIGGEQLISCHYKKRFDYNSTFSVMDLESGIVEFPHSFKECRTDMKVVRHCDPLKI